MARHPDAPVRLLRNDQNYGLGGSHKVAFGYAAAHGYEHLVVLHGDDQGAIADLLPILNDGTYKKLRLLPWLPLYEGQQDRRLQRAAHLGQLRLQLALQLSGPQKIHRSGQRTEPVCRGTAEKASTTKTFPDTLYFNDCMILALCQMKQRVLFFPISWREEDQVSNNKLTSFGISLLKLCGKYLAGPRAFVEREWREKIIEDYSYEVVASNL